MAMAGLRETGQVPGSKLECPICFDDLRPPIFQCFNGHLLCGTCINEVKVCPVCRDALPEKKIKALAVEKLLRDFNRPCPFRKQGCEKILASSDGDHPFQCQYAHIDWLEYARFKSLPTKKKEGEVGRGRSEGCFSFTVNNISERLRGTKIMRSAVVHVQNLPWRIKLEPHYKGGKKKFLGISLECVEESSRNWSCNAMVRFRILSHIIRNGTANHHTKRFNKHQQFRSGSGSGYRSWGYKEFLDWGSLKDPYNGFEKNGSVTVEVHIKADVPRRGHGRI